ncbi:hypothetical protein FGB62_316g00 [Gracilaria domingensis]|nr:hypothetical protein FGB62_316g00 [Gracilaria domingensis]
MSDPTKSHAVHDSQQNALMQSPIMQVAEHNIRQLTAPKPSMIDSHPPPTFHDNDITMSEKSSKMVTEDVKAQSTSEVHTHKEFGSLGDEQSMDTSMRANARKEAASAQNIVVKVVGTGMYPTCVYTNGLVDRGLIVKHHPASPQQAKRLRPQRLLHCGLCF